MTENCMIKTRYKVSVIVPVYNVEQYAEKCITSILRQTLHDFELILVDDCGTDNSMSVINDLLTCKFPKGIPDCVHILHNPRNLGISPSRNSGLDIASGEYITFIDCDDYIAEDYLEALYRAAKEADADVALCGYRKVEPDGKLIRTVRLDHTNVEAERYRMLLPWAHLYRRDFLELHHAQFRNVFSEDVVFNLSINGYVKHAAVIPDTGYYYVQRPGSVMNQGKGIYTERRFPFRELSQILAEAKDNGVSAEVYTRLEYETVKAFASMMLSFMRHCDKKSLDIHASTAIGCLDDIAPRCYNNPYLPITALPALPITARVGTYLFAKAYRHCCLKLFVWLVTRF